MSLVLILLWVGARESVIPMVSRSEHELMREILGWTESCMVGWIAPAAVL